MCAFRGNAPAVIAEGDIPFLDSSTAVYELAKRLAAECHIVETESARSVEVAAFHRREKRTGGQFPGAVH